MTRLGIRTIALTGAAALAATLATPASAQATRTWVSGVGDDVNPCSRTAPCKTFAGAISKTAAGGEINCLDPGGYGAVTITKSMTIDCHYTEGGALAGGNGITVNDSATATPNTAVVYLRGLDIFGVNPPSNGVRFIAGAALHIEDSVIRRFNSAGSFGISFQPGGAAKLYVTNTTVAHNGNVGGTGGGILVQPTGAGGSAKVELSDVRVRDNDGVGLKVDTAGNTSPVGTVVSATRSSFSGSPIGVSANMAAGAPTVQVTVVDSQVTLNTVAGLAAAGTGSAVIRASGNIIFGNQAAVLNSGTGTVRSYGDNLVDGNVAASSFSGVDLTKD
jgi:hypothetical protein